VSRRQDALTPSMFNERLTKIEPAPAPATPRARRTDPETSHAAAESIKPKAMRESQRWVLAALAAGPATDSTILERVLRAHEISTSGARTRRKELVDAGLVRYTGRTEPLESGRSSRVWALTPLGSAAARGPGPTANRGATSRG